MNYSKKTQLNNNAPLADRQEARKDLTEACNDLSGIAIDLGHLMAGNYGYESYEYLLEHMENKRMNRNAVVFQMIAAYEYQCPGVFANQVYNKLEKGQRYALNSLIESAINEFLEAKHEAEA